MSLRCSKPRIIGGPSALSRELCVMPTYVALRPSMAYTVTSVVAMGLIEMAACMVNQMQSCDWACFMLVGVVWFCFSRAVINMAVLTMGGKRRSLWLAFARDCLLPLS